MKNKSINKPKLHLTGKRNWINDPNGLIYYKGKYHMFYQHFPYAPQWGTMHWGHAISDDMVNWTYEPIALFPTKLYDRNGCFSGSAIEVNGDLYLYYTSVKYLDTPEDNITVPKDDLFEASKATSGAMELNITKIDIVQLLKQSLGENDERFKNSNLSVKLDIPDTKIFINGDGQRLYRVFENLISNIVKYSLSNTRVYIQMYVDDENKVVIIMRNISAYELDFCANEITNRFKRGDSSRSTEGSGLGLAIAKSIVELHGGKFNIEVDGDLFKSIIKLNQ